MLDREFCEFLEHSICKAFEDPDNEALKGFWCDGVLLPAAAGSYSHKSVNDNRRISLKAFIGKEGQSEYELILKFGNKALSRYARNLHIKDCIPVQRGTNWLDVNIEKKRIEIQLD